MRKTMIKLSMLIFILAILQSCNKTQTIQSLDQYAQVILSSIRNNDFKELKPLLLKTEDSILFNDKIYHKPFEVWDDIQSFMINNKVNKDYILLIRKRFKLASQEFIKKGINPDSISLEFIKLRTILGGNKDNFRSYGDIVFTSCGAKYVLKVTDILYSNNIYKNFNFNSLNTYESVFSENHKKLMEIIPWTGIKVESWNSTAHKDDYNSPVRLKSFSITLNNSTHWNFEGFAIRIKLFEKGDSPDNPIYSILIKRRLRVNQNDRILIEVPELENYIIPNSAAYANKLDCYFEIVDLNWVDEFNVPD